MVESTVCRSSVELTAWLISPSARSSPTELTKLVGTFAQLSREPRILDGDDGLGGEILDKIDLLVVKRLDFLAVDDEAPDHLAILKHRHADH